MKFDRMIMAWHRSDETSKRLRYIPGVGPMLATALVASADPKTFRSGTKRTFQHVRFSAANGGKADNMCSREYFAF